MDRESAMLCPLPQLRVSKFLINAFMLTPNTTITKKPLLIYHSAFDPSRIAASSLEDHFSRTGVVTPRWRYTMYSTSHFHSTTHEVLGVSSGSAKLCFGHEDNPGKAVVEVSKGDVLIIPAGTAHRLLDDLAGGFEMVGCYPEGCDWDMCYGRHGEEDRVARIAKLEWFVRDPVYGDKGPVLEV